MECQRYREQLSARMDGEDTDVLDRQLDAHLAACPECRSWADAAVAVNRRLRVQRVRELPDLSGRILRAALAGTPARVPLRRVGVLARVALVVVGVAQLALGLAQLFGLSHMGMSMASMAGQDHLFNESTAWNLAVASGLLVAAIRPRLARGFLAPLAMFVAVLTIVSIGDIVARQVTTARLESHVFLVLGLMLLFLVDRTSRVMTPVGGETARPLDDFGLRAGNPLDVATGWDEVGSQRRRRRTDGQQRGRHAA